MICEGFRRLILPAEGKYLPDADSGIVEGNRKTRAGME